MKNSFEFVAAALLYATSPVVRADSQICQGQNVPPGWVVVGQPQGVAKCSGTSGGNAYNIKQPGPTEIICQGSPMPANYEQVKIMSGQMACHDGNAYLIKRK